MRGRGGEGKEVKRSKLTGAQRERDGSLSSSPPFEGTRPFRDGSAHLKERVERACKVSKVFVAIVHATWREDSEGFVVDVGELAVDSDFTKKVDAQDCVKGTSDGVVGRVETSVRGGVCAREE